MSVHHSSLQPAVVPALATPLLFGSTPSRGSRNRKSESSLARVSTPHSLSLFDWWIVLVLVLGLVAVGTSFTRRAGRNLESFFVSGRLLPWYVAGASMTATSFSADTPLWITSLVRTHGIAAVWQFWAPLFGSVLVAVYFSRLWRRMAFVTDLELLEARYTGGTARILRGWSGATGALLYCPLIVSWVLKGMETVAREAMGLSPADRLGTTFLVMAAGLVVSVAAGLVGLAYAELLQLSLAVVASVVLAAYSVRAVGGLEALGQHLALSAESHVPRSLSLWPTFGEGPGQMTWCNAVGFFGLLWLAVATSTGGYHTQRLLATRTQREAGLAQFFFSILYYGALAWPWIVVALCSLVLLPHLGAADASAAYPQMITRVLPEGWRGFVVAALTCAFFSTVSSLFNWGASYVSNDLYRRFLHPGAKPWVYVFVGRVAAVFIALAGASISLVAKDIQQLLTIFYVLATGEAVLRLLRWLWWRLTAAGDMAGLVTGWGVTFLLLFGRVFDAPARQLFGWEPSVALSSDAGLLGARMLLVLVVQTFVVVVVSLLTQPTERAVLTEFVRRARPFRLGWAPIYAHLADEATKPDSGWRVLPSWLLGVAAILFLLCAGREVLLGDAWYAAAYLGGFLVSAAIQLYRLRRDQA